jgi:hypothetical protein
MSKKTKAKATASERVENVRSNVGAINRFFKKASEVNREGFEVKSRPPTIKPVDFSPGMVLEGVLVGVHGIPATKKGDGKPWCKIHIKPEGDRIGVEMAAGALLRSALEINAEDAEGATSPFIGHLVTIELGDPVKLPSKKGNDAWNFIVGISPDKA